MPEHEHEHGLRRPPHDCPVCGDELVLSRLSCESCGTELSGAFGACEFCALNAEDRALLQVFLASRGNMKELERSLNVSYPTARARFDAVLGRLGIERPAAGADRSEVLDALAAGTIDVEEALKRL